jgi:hypothetical protein
LLCWEYIVTSPKALTIFHSWIHPLHHLSLLFLYVYFFLLNFIFHFSFFEQIYLNESTKDEGVPGSCDGYSYTDLEKQTAWCVSFYKKGESVIYSCLLTFLIISTLNFLDPYWFPNPSRTSPIMSYSKIIQDSKWNYELRRKIVRI